jgi:hypothetical protein
MRAVRADAREDCGCGVANQPLSLPDLPVRKHSLLYTAAQIVRLVNKGYYSRFLRAIIWVTICSSVLLRLFCSRASVMISLITNGFLTA